MTEIAGAEAAARMLQLYDVKHIFQLRGDTNLPSHDALYRPDHLMERVPPRDKRSAGLVTEASACVTGKVGVREGPNGGATCPLPGIIDAKESSIRALAITSDAPVTSRGRFPLAEVDTAAPVSA